MVREQHLIPREDEDLVHEIIEMFRMLEEGGMSERQERMSAGLDALEALTKIEAEFDDDYAIEKMAGDRKPTAQEVRELRKRMEYSLTVGNDRIQRFTDRLWELMRAHG